MTPQATEAVTTTSTPVAGPPVPRSTARRPADTSCLTAPSPTVSRAARASVTLARFVAATVVLVGLLAVLGWVVSP